MRHIVLAVTALIASATAFAQVGEISVSGGASRFSGGSPGTVDAASTSATAPSRGSVPRASASSGIAAASAATASAACAAGPHARARPAWPPRASPAHAASAGTTAVRPPMPAGLASGVPSPRPGFRGGPRARDATGRPRRRRNVARGVGRDQRGGRPSRRTVAISVKYSSPCWVAALTYQRVSSPAPNAPIGNDDAPTAAKASASRVIG